MKQATLKDVETWLEIHRANQEVGKHNHLFEFVAKWFEGQAAKIVLTFENEYNDETYDSRPVISAFDENDFELERKETEKEDGSSSYDEWYDYAMDYKEREVGEYSERPDLIIFAAKRPLPNLYID